MISFLFYWLGFKVLDMVSQFIFYIIVYAAIRGSLARLHPKQLFTKVFNESWVQKLALGSFFSGIIQGDRESREIGMI